MRPADVQFLHGRVPSPMHLTFLRWQASQARLAVVGSGAADEGGDSGVVPAGLSPLEETDTSTGPFSVEISMSTRTCNKQQDAQG